MGDGVLRRGKGVGLFKNLSLCGLGRLDKMGLCACLLGTWPAWPSDVHVG